MSTNYYILTKNKKIIERYGLSYEITDEPDFGYWVHLAQTAGKYKPLFQAHKEIRCINDLCRLIKTESDIQIYDEYSRPLTVQEFMDNVVLRDGESRFFERPRFMNDYVFLSDYGRYFADDDGNEFCETDFV